VFWGVLALVLTGLRTVAAALWLVAVALRPAELGPLPVEIAWVAWGVGVAAPSYKRFAA